MLCRSIGATLLPTVGVIPGYFATGSISMEVVIEIAAIWLSALSGRFYQMTLLRRDVKARTLVSSSMIKTIL